MEKSNFTGPLFVVGMPRSGTKLLRDLLNQHENIAIPNAETEFLPYLLELCRQAGDLSVRSNFSWFYLRITKQPYFTYIFEEKGFIISEETWFSRLYLFSPPEVFEVLIRHDAECFDQQEMIWGDKSPSYTKSIKLIKLLFPAARFVHIVRDARDYCLSINKAWGKNIYRAAQRWSDDVGRVRLDAMGFHEDFLEIRYEDLLSKPEETLSKVCTFLGIAYEPRISKLSKPSENLGEAKGKNEIIANNKGRYLSIMPQKTKRKVELIAGRMLKAYGYDVDFAGPSQRLSRFRMFSYRILDGINLLYFSVRERGLREAIKMRYGGFVQQSKSIVRQSKGLHNHNKVP